MKRLESEGACFTIDVLGEEISSLDEAQYFLDEYVRVMHAIVEQNLDANLSIKPTAFGLLIDKEKGMENIESLVQQASEHDMFVRLDMEDHRVTTETIKVVLDLHAKGLTNVGTVLQGRLHRTPDDIDNVAKAIGSDADYRICKGIYLEPESMRTPPRLIFVQRQTKPSVWRLNMAHMLELHHMIFLLLTTHWMSWRSSKWGQIRTIHETMLVHNVVVKGRVMNFKCSLGFEGRCVEN